MPEHGRLAPVHADVGARASEQLDGRCVGIGGERRHDTRRVLHDRPRPLEPGLDPADAAGDDAAPRQAVAKRLHVFDAVQLRDDRLDRRLYALERVVERRCLDRDEQELDGLAQLRVRLGASRLHLLAMSQGQSLGPDHCGRVRTGDADDAHARACQADGEHAADGAGAEDGDGHVSAGSAIRFTYFHSL